MERVGQACNMVTMSFRANNAAFAEDLLCAAFFVHGRRNIWDAFVIAIAAFRMGTAARGAMLSSSFVPFCVRPILGAHSNGLVLQLATLDLNLSTDIPNLQTILYQAGTRQGGSFENRTCI